MNVAVVEMESGFTFAVKDDESWPIYFQRECTRLGLSGKAWVNFFVWDRDNPVLRRVVAVIAYAL